MTDRTGAKVRLPPPLVGIAAIVGGWLLGKVLPLAPGFAIDAPARYWVGGGIAVAAFAVLGAWPIILFRETHQDPTPWTDTPELVFRGPYRFTRNPMYLMMLLVCIGFSIILASLWILLLTPLVALVVYRTAIRHEEAYLAGKFGDAYLQYRARVRRWL